MGRSLFEQTWFGHYCPHWRPWHSELTSGVRGVVSNVFSGALASIPGAAAAVEAGMDKEVEANVKELFPEVEGPPSVVLAYPLISPYVIAI